MGMYASNMSNFESAVEAQITANIQNLIAAKGTTRKHVFDKARMSRTTFDRAMAGARSFTVSEIMSIADALDVTPDKLLPSEWVAADQAA
jgi:transcriptional regulator with XRE-family HTH domain